ncbi:HAD-IA family hydrolase [Jiangella alkaliphila]|uniref:Sugar-phosphatase n=1 Tax=Jiangella alkaliphila TaxID=419479 RepID=A0A1H2L5G3_9ACTN|nr:HAD-IA family hydrolase [Jiangella alkaliphila]SDU76179.1 sugar-phosphatase [Jiangella alkaliphila]
MVLKAEAILLDLDGTLVDSTDSIARSWLRWCRQYDVDPARLAGAHGRTTADIVAGLLPGPQVSAALARIDEIEIEDAGTVRPMPGAAELLASIPADRRAIVTSGSTVIATARMRAAGLEPAAVIVTADDVLRGKPHPEPYLLGAQRLGADPARCVVVEDAPSGIAAARAAGMAVVGVVSTHEARQLEADLVAASPAHIRVDGTGPLLVDVTPRVGRDRR